MGSEMCIRDSHHSLDVITAMDWAVDCRAAHQDTVGIETVGERRDDFGHKLHQFKEGVMIR